MRLVTKIARRLAEPAPGKTLAAGPSWCCPYCPKRFMSKGAAASHARGHGR